MSSYCLTLMVIGYLQHRGCLPNLQVHVRVDIPDLPGDTSNPDVVWVGWGKEQGIKAHVGFKKSPPPGWEPGHPDLTVAGAIRGFFAYFSRTSFSPEERFDYSTSAISILNGGVLRRDLEPGSEARIEAAKRSEMVSQGFSLDVINQTMVEARQARYEEETYMGKGDRGIQPRNWGERKIVVHDPFLWTKVS